MADVGRDGLIAEYLFQGNAADTSGAGHHGVVQGASLTADRFGHPDGAFRFDGIDDEIVVDPPPAMTADAITVSVWAKFEPRHRRDAWSDCIIAQDDGRDDDQSRRIFQLSAHDRHIVWHRMTCARDPACKYWIRDGEWYHVVATFAGGQHTLYVDAERHDAVAADFAAHHEQPLHIGRTGTIEPCFFFRGAIDDVRIYRRAVGEDEVRALFHEGGFSKPPRVRSAARDPLSGRWGRYGVNVLDLRFDGTGGVTGDVMDGEPNRRAAIVSGSFDRETATLRLEGFGRHRKTNEPMPYVVEGRLDEGELSVTAKIDRWQGNRHLTKRGARWPWRHTVAHRLTRGIHRLLGLSSGD